MIRLAETADQTAVPDGMSIPEELQRRDERLTAIAQAKAKIEARAKERFEKEQAAYEASMAARKAKAEASGKKAGGKEPKAPQEGPLSTDQISLTDEDSRIMRAADGHFDQCYNAQAIVDTETLLVIATHVTQAANDKEQVAPMIAKLKAQPEGLNAPERILADNGYFSEKNVNHCADAKIEPLIAVKRDRHHPPLLDRFTEPAPLPEGVVTTRLEKMKHQLKTTAGKALYALRKQTVEPVFGIIKSVMGFRQFSLRGLIHVNHEWNLVCLAWNLKRMAVLRPKCR